MKTQYMMRDEMDVRPDVALYYKLHLGPATSTTIFDYSGNNNTGTLSGTNIAPAFPGFSFNGSDDFINVGNQGSAIKTIAMWIKPSQVENPNYVIDLNGTDYIVIENEAVGVNGFAGNTLYVDGVAVDTVKVNVWQLIALTIATAKTASDLDIGRVEGVGLFTGLIGEIILSVNELSELDVMNLYQTSRRRYDGK